MRLVEVKTEDQQSVLSIHRTHNLAVRQRTGMANMISSLLQEFGHILPIGIKAVTAFAKRHPDGDHPDMPDVANGMPGMQCYQFIGLNEHIAGYSKMIEQHALPGADARRLMRMPGIGRITASAIVAPIDDAGQFRTGRDLATWLGLTPLNKSSGDKERPGKITKKGDRYIRKLLVVGITPRAAMEKRSPEKVDLWTANIIAEKPFRLATTAMANKAAKIIRAMLTKKQEFQRPAF